MADARALRHEPAHGLLRARRTARCRGDDHSRSVPVAHRVTVFHAADCSLCARALAVVEALRREVDFELRLVDIGGDDELEARYREFLPVVEIDGERAFSYFVDAEAFRARVES